MEKLENYFVAVLAFLIVYFLFAATNINPTLGTIYAIFSAASLLFLVVDSKRSLKFRQPGSSIIGSIAVGAFAYIALITVGNFIIIPGINEVVKLLGATTPVLATNVFFEKFTFGVAIPIAETSFFFITLYDLLATSIGAEISWSNIKKPKIIGLILFISSLFLVFHLTAKGIGNPAILGLVFFMALISLLITTYFRDGEKATYFHIISNLISII